MVINRQFWQGRNVFLTGCTGFKGGWLALWLSQAGARVIGYSLDAPTTPNFYEAVNLRQRLTALHVADVRDLASVERAMRDAQPSVVIHMAAQSLVHHSYEFPLETFSSNVMGVANVLEASRRVESIEAVIVVTTDKCYEVQELQRPYQEEDRLGGHDPYSSSKACAELVTEAFRRSFFEHSGVALATVRAGNVIGGGDWAQNRLVPDFFRSVEQGQSLAVRRPGATRPWQHVLEPLSGYLLLAEKLVSAGFEFATAWNFGPDEGSVKTVGWVSDYLSQKVKGASWAQDKRQHPHETEILSLDSEKAVSALGWQPRWSIETALDATIAWYEAQQQLRSMDEYSLSQILLFESA